MGSALLDILHLLPDFFYFAADNENMLMNIQAVGLGGNGMGFALHLLG
jgi:hypothetical protein